MKTRERLGRRLKARQRNQLKAGQRNQLKARQRNQLKARQRNQLKARQKYQMQLDLGSKANKHFQVQLIPRRGLTVGRCNFAVPTVRLCLPFKLLVFWITRPPRPPLRKLKWYLLQVVSLTSLSR